MRAAQFLAEFRFGKPKGQLEVDVGLFENTLERIRALMLGIDVETLEEAP